MQVFGVICILFQISFVAAVTVSKVERSIDLTSQLVKISSQVTFQNNGNGPVNEVLLAVEDEHSKHLSFVEVTNKNDEENKLRVSPPSQPKGGKQLSVSLNSPLSKDGTITLNVEMIFTHKLEPFPTQIAQADKQQVVYKGNTYFYSPYDVKEQKTTVKLPSSTIESYSRLKPTSSNDNIITYGPYKDAKPFKTHEMKVHFENNSPFVGINEMTRWIEVSHWGNIAVEETYHITHNGAKLKNHFSRYDYQRSPTHAAVRSFKTVLPASARDVYYRDEIGNISTSNMLVQDDSVEVELRPRFPLFGGWQTRYYLGYNLPAYQYLYNKGKNYILKMRVVDHVFDDFVLDNLVLKIALPEGAENIKFKAPFAVTEGKRELHKTYLDTFGRTVVVIRKENLVENHIQDFELHYTFSKIYLLQEPLLCVTAFFALFLAVFFIVRIDVSITEDKAKESRMKIASSVEKLLSACDRRTGIYSSFDSALDKFKQGKDAATFAATSKKLRQDYANVSQSITGVCDNLVKEDADIGEKLTEMKKKENERKGLLDQLVTLAEKVVGNKMGRQQYLESEQKALNRRNKIAEEIDSILSTI